MSDEPANQPENEKPPIVDVTKLNNNLPDEYIALKVSDEEGGTGSVYKVPIDTYAALKAAINGKGYDIDNYYGWQCWDGTALLWQQFGLHLITGNGLAIGCWDLKRDVNKYDKFSLITKVDSLKLGDVVCMRPNHIGYFDGFDGAYMRILGQNQGGSPGPNGGSAFNIVRITKSAFAGAFRLKQWHKPQEVEMVTSQGLAVIYRFLLGTPTSDYGKQNYLGKVTFDEAYARVKASDAYKKKVATAKSKKEVDLQQFPSAIRQAIGIN